MSSTTATLAAPITTGTVRRHPVRRATVVSGAAAAVATTAVAAVADAAGVPLAIEGESIPLFGFAQMTLLGAIIGGLLVALLNRYSAQPRRRFLVASVVLTVLSCVPSVAMPQDTATKVILVATHLAAASIIVPALARRARS